MLTGEHTGRVKSGGSADPVQKVGEGHTERVGMARHARTAGGLRPRACAEAPCQMTGTDTKDRVGATFMRQLPEVGPSAIVPRAGICAGGAGHPASPPRQKLYALCSAA